MRRPCRQCLQWLAVFAVLATIVSIGFADALDNELLRIVGNMRADPVTRLLKVITAIGGGAILIPLAFGIMGLIWRYLGSGVAKRFFLCSITGEILYVGAKAVFRRERPDVIERLSGAGWHSFPSGHTMMSAIVFGSGLLLLAGVVANGVTRRVLFSLALLLPVSVAFSRVYLGVHYPSDVLAALALGAAWGYLWFGVDPSSSCDTSVMPAAR